MSQWEAPTYSEQGAQALHLCAGSQLRTDSLCWAQCGARMLCNRSQRRHLTAAGTSCRGCRPGAPADDRAAHGQLGSSEPVVEPPVRSWVLPAPFLHCPPRSHCFPGTVLLPGSPPFRTTVLRVSTPPRSRSFLALLFPVTVLFRPCGCWAAVSSWGAGAGMHAHQRVVRP